MFEEPLSLTWEEFRQILNRIDKKHRFGRGGWHIKYVRPSLDFRDRKIFNIQFNGMFHDSMGYFDFRDSEEPMFNRIMDWLENKEEEVDTYL